MRAFLIGFCVLFLTGCYSEKGKEYLYDVVDHSGNKFSNLKKGICDTSYGARIISCPFYTKEGSEIRFYPPFTEIRKELNRDLKVKHLL